MFLRLILRLWFALFPCVVFGQLPASIKASLQSEDWKVRAEAFISLKALLPHPDAANALVALLEKENSVAFRPDEFLMRPDFKPSGEANAEYFVDLLQTVGSLDTGRAAIALAGAAGRGTIVSDVLVKWAKTVAPVLTQQMLSSPSTELRIGSAQDLEVLLLNKTARTQLSSSEMADIKAAFYQLASDPKPVLRQNAVYGLIAVGDPSVFPVLKRLASEDPDRRVKEAAVKALSRLQPQ